MLVQGEWLPDTTRVPVTTRIGVDDCSEARGVETDAASLMAAKLHQNMETIETGSPDVLDTLLADPLFGQCSYHSLARLLPQTSVIRLGHSQALFQAGELADMFYLLVSGGIRLTLPSGRRLELAHARCGEESGTETLHYLSSAQATQESTLLCIPRTALAPLVAANPTLKTDLLLSLSSHLAGEPMCRERPSGLCVESRAPAVSPIRLTGWLLTLLTPLLILFFQTSIEQSLGLGASGIIFLAIFSATVAMWVFSLLDDYIPGLFAVLAMLVTGLVPAPVILSGFASDGFMMAMSTLALSVVIVSSGLSYRGMLLLLRNLPNGQIWQNLGIFLAGALLTPVIPTANGRTALVAPFLSDMVDSLRLATKGPAATRLAVMCFGGVSLLSATVMTSKSVNFVVYGLLPPQDQDHFQWLTWLFSALVALVVLSLIYSLGAMLWFRNREKAVVPKNLVASQLSLLGPMKSREWAALAALGFVVVSIVTSSLHKIQPPWLVLTVLLALLCFGTLRKKEFNQQVDWTFLLYLSGITGIVSAFNHLGLAKTLGAALSSVGVLLQGNFEGFVLLLFVLISVIRLAVPINATIVILAAVLMPLAEMNAINPWVIGFVILMFSEMWFLPYQCSYYLQLRGLNQTRLIYDEGGFLRFNAVMNLARLAAVYLSLPFWRTLGLL